MAPNCRGRLRRRSQLPLQTPRLLGRRAPSVPASLVPALLVRALLLRALLLRALLVRALPLRQSELGPGSPMPPGSQWSGWSAPGSWPG